MLRSLLVIVTAIFSTAQVQAQESLEGWLIASQECEAFQSKNQMTNPGDVRLVVGSAYEMIGINSVGGDWYQVRLNDVPVTAARWVAVTCGTHVVAADDASISDQQDIPDFVPQSGEEAKDLLIALSWQPAFCESKPGKTECRQLNDGLLPITETQLSLHGLWPQPNGNFYCGVSDRDRNLDKANRWAELPAPELDQDTLERLAVAMPGTASFLDRHEWIKHGTCFFGDGNGDEYYDDSLRVMDAINEGGIAELLTAHVGAHLETETIRETFDVAFGAGAGERVQVKCKGDQGRLLIQEVTVTLVGEITEDVDVAELIIAAEPQSPGCPGGTVDPVGLQ